MASGAAPAAAALLALAVLLGAYEADAECKNCITLDKEGRSLLRAHWRACGGGGAGGGAGGGGGGGGGWAEGDAKRLAYCALRRCKLLAKDGKLRKAALAHAARYLPADVAKVLERCSNQTGDTPEDLAWNIFRCAFDPKVLMLDLPQPATQPRADD